MDISHPQLESTMKYLKVNSVPISPLFPHINSNYVKSAGLLGSDVIQQLDNFQTVPFQNGKLLKLADGLIPIGSLGKLINKDNLCEKILSKQSEVGQRDWDNSQYLSSASAFAESRDSALTSDDGFNLTSANATTSFDASSIKVDGSKPVVNNKKKIKQLSAAEIRQSVNFVLNPNPTYFSPMEKVFPDSNMEQGLEYLYSLESLGISKEYLLMTKNK